LLRKQAKHSFERGIKARKPGKCIEPLANGRGGGFGKLRKQCELTDEQNPNIFDG
jgi:hypothetical protein